MIPRNPWLVAGGCLSLAAALLHVAIIVGGPDWYRFFGAGEAMARMAERGSWAPASITFGIAIILGIWAAYAFAGAGLIRRLPLMRAALVAISGVYLLRALLFPLMASIEGEVTRFNAWSSAIVLVYGLAYAVGTWRAWPHLTRRKVSHAVGS